MGFLKIIYQLLLDIIRNWPDGQKDVTTLPMNTDITEAVANLSKTKRERILDAARSYLGKDASPENKADSEVACAESVAHILNPITPSIPKGVLSTVELAYHLDHSHDFKSTRIPKEGNVIVSPRRGSIYGHTGIFITNDTIASNESKTGLFEINYNFQEWADEMRTKRGLRIFIFEAI